MHRSEIYGQSDAPYRSYKTYGLVAPAHIRPCAACLSDFPPFVIFTGARGFPSASEVNNKIASQVVKCLCSALHNVCNNVFVIIFSVYPLNTKNYIL